jgi:hypothetical protein
MKTVCHRIADLVFRTESEIDIPHIHTPPFSLFEIPTDTPHDILLRFFHIGDDVASPGASPIARFSREVDGCLGAPILEAFLSQPATGRFFQLEKEQLILRDYRSLSLTAIARSKVDGHGAGIHLATNLRLHFCAFLPRYEAMSIHTGGIVRNGRALLLVAPDEGGKTTAVKLARGCPILHDDQVIIRRVGGVIHAHATPFGHLTDGPNSAALGGVFFLEQAPDFSIEPIRAREMLRCLWHGHPSFLAGLPKEERVRAFDLLHAVSYQTPAFHMRFPIDYIDWDAVDRALVAG